MLGENEKVDEINSFNNSSVPKKLLIILAGAIFNIIFGLILYYLIMISKRKFYRY